MTMCREKIAADFIFLWVFKNILLEKGCFTVLSQFLLHGKVNCLSVDIDPLFFGFSSCLDHHRALSRVPSSVQQVLIGYVTHSINSKYTSTPASQSTPPLSPPWCPHLCSLHPCLCFCFVNKIVYPSLFSYSTYMHQCTVFAFLSDLLHSDDGLQVHPCLKLPTLNTGKLSFKNKVR